MADDRPLDFSARVQAAPRSTFVPTASGGGARPDTSGSGTPPRKAARVGYKRLTEANLRALDAHLANHPQARLALLRALARALPFALTA